jgi:hypothetical protein
MWSQEEIDAGRATDRLAKARYSETATVSFRPDSRSTHFHEYKLGRVIRK